MKTSPDGIARICARESFSPHRYWDVSRWSIGYGTIWTEGMADPYTQDQACEWMGVHLAGDEAMVNRVVKVPLTQCQFDALVSFSYNEGDGALPKSTTLIKLNAGDYQGAADALLGWNKEMKGGELVTSSELLERRQEERAQFLSDAKTDPPPAELPTLPELPRVEDVASHSDEPPDDPTA
jgi:lysozyme